MSNISWGYWAQTVSSHIKFKPDRAAVEEELLAHLEDKRDVLLHAGMTYYEAEKKALSEMGDADEIGRALAAVHKPWLGYLWLWSRRVLILCIVVLVWAALGFESRVLFLDEEKHEGSISYFDLRQDFEDGTSNEHLRMTYLTPSCEDESDGYTFTVPEALLYDREAYTAEDGREVRRESTLYLSIKAAAQMPRLASCTAFREFYAVDDLGNRYGEARYYSPNDRSVAGNYVLTGFFTCEYDCWIVELDPEARWIELCYDRDGRDVRLRIDLTGGEVK